MTELGLNHFVGVSLSTQVSMQHLQVLPGWYSGIGVYFSNRD